ncbi:MAG: PilT/PilU family type 4a pilus ATPase [Xanthomonadales bacterium]|nr:PilT/PilU family type 4a pilus ATPase [Xanthomonadales bacterium]
MTVPRWFEPLLSYCIESKASDIHLTADEAVFLRVHGELSPVPDTAHCARAVSHEEMNDVVQSLSNTQQRDVLNDSGSLDMGYSLGTERFRINIYRYLHRYSMAIRHIDDQALSFEQLKLPPQVRQLAELRSGLILVTGATGSGKSTTLAACIRHINEHRRCHILTVEDPIEFMHSNVKSLIHQRELYTDVPDFATAVKASLREDPDVIMVGEMRDQDTMRAAITAAETGHLVLSTMHTVDTPGTIERLIGSFPAAEQDVIRGRIALSLQGVIAQRLLPNLQGGARVPAVEILLVNHAIRHLIENGKTRQIYAALESGTRDGMQTIDQALALLVSNKLVAYDQARPHCRDPKMFDELIRSRGRAQNLGGMSS